jgi:hypothetical protein
VFKEIGLDDDDISPPKPLAVQALSESIVKDAPSLDITSKIHSIAMERPKFKGTSSTPPRSFSSLSRVAMIVCFIAVVIPSLLTRPGKETTIIGADAGVVRPSKDADLFGNGFGLDGRDSSLTDVCTRWSHQTANVNGTLYIYGGRAKTSSSQTTDTWSDYPTSSLEGVY